MFECELGAALVGMWVSFAVDAYSVSKMMVFDP